MPSVWTLYRELQLCTPSRKKSVILILILQKETPPKTDFQGSVSRNCPYIWTNTPLYQDLKCPLEVSFRGHFMTHPPESDFKCTVRLATLPVKSSS